MAAKRRPTAADVAQVAGVGLATVDRVLNGRAPVRKETVDRVKEAAEQLGYHALPLIRRRVSARIANVRLGFVLQKQADPFYQNVATALRREFSSRLEVSGKLEIVFVDEISARSLGKKILEVGTRTDAVACVAIEHPLVVEAIDELNLQRKSVFTLLSGISASGVTGYIGLDSRKVGRTGAFIISRMAPAKGKIATLVGSHRYRGQEVSEIGFRSFFREIGDEARLLETIVNLDDPEVAREVTTILLDRHVDLAAIYDAGGGRDGIIEAIRTHSSGQRPIVVCNDLTGATRSALIDGIITCVLCLPVEAFARAVIDEMIASITGSRAVAPNRTLPFNVVFPENLPA
ncbi:LacI family DNA-binding transcriptional regulator [Rhizobium binxianense]|uniref:LacI family DNA-binding transcriptional regulator n=1 Tax=Rhizobium binxianense TaxID=3024242 RepID=UPI00235E242E|nr:substrate-binding domain-containing protein [Rhizobium sp. MC62]MDC9813114.1 substrate-binding domain-containing protein [Rhizobium sp. MC62]